MQEIGRELYNDACTTGSDVHLYDRAPDRLSVDQQGEIFVTVLTLALVKLVNGIEQIRKPWEIPTHGQVASYTHSAGALLRDAIGLLTRTT